jgi:hypothetical protein
MNDQMSWARYRQMTTLDFGDGRLDYRLTSGTPKVENVLMFPRHQTFLNGINTL